MKTKNTKKITMTKEEKEFLEHKKSTIEIARDLMYPKEVIEKIKNAKTSNEITRIMTTQRQAW